MADLQFTKGQGTGNDFVLFADPAGEIDLTDTQVQALCDRHFGIGADGTIRAVLSTRIPEGRAALEEDPDAEWFMDYRNVDGSPAEMCGNGIRVFTLFLIENGLIELPPGRTIPIGTRAGVRDVQRSGSGFQVDLGRWELAGGEPLVRAKDLQVARPGLGIDVGNPHVGRAVERGRARGGRPRVRAAAGSRARRRRERRAGGAGGSARRRRGGPHHHARPRARERRDAELRHRGRGGSPRDAALGGVPQHRTSGASSCRAVRSACACSRPRTASTWASRDRPSSSSTASWRWPDAVRRRASPTPDADARP